MRVAAYLLSAFLLVGCSGESRDEVRFDLPLKAPEGGHSLVADFVDICSLSLVDQSSAKKLAVERGWNSEVADMDLMAQFAGMAVYTDEKTGANLQMMPVVYPHLDIKICMINLFEDDLSLIHI